MFKALYNTLFKLYQNWLYLFSVDLWIVFSLLLEVGLFSFCLIRTQSLCKECLSVIIVPFIRLFLFILFIVRFLRLLPIFFVFLALEVWILRGLLALVVFVPTHLVHEFGALFALCILGGLTNFQYSLWFMLYCFETAFIFSRSKAKIFFIIYFVFWAKLSICAVLSDISIWGNDVNLFLLLGFVSVLWEDACVII